MKWGNGTVTRALRIDDGEAFDTLMDACRSYASAGNDATQAIIFEPMIITILLSQHKMIMRLNEALDSTQQTQDCLKLAVGFLSF